MESISKRIKAAYIRGDLSRAIKERLRPYYKGSIDLFRTNEYDISIHVPEYIKPDKKDNELIERIFRAYKAMKSDQKKMDSVYSPSSIWQAQLDKSFSYLNSALKNDDLDTFHFFLANFGSWKSYHGIENNIFMHHMNKTFLTKAFLKKSIFSSSMNFWKYMYNSNKDISKLSYPQYGNQSGVYFNENGKKQFVGLGSFFNEIYGNILSQIVSDINRPIIAELGAGYGKLAYFTVRDLKEFCYIDFDLPETLSLASYYLMKTFPNKKVLLYGEDEFTENSHNNYDLIFMPSFMIKKYESNKMSNVIDLFINKNSLGEMKKESVDSYFKAINNVSKYFFHMNHELMPNIYNDNEKGYLGYEYPIDSNKYKILMRYPDFDQMIYDGNINRKRDIFFYLYSRKNK